MAFNVFTLLLFLIVPIISTEVNKTDVKTNDKKGNFFTNLFSFGKAHEKTETTANQKRSFFSYILSSAKPENKTDQPKNPNDASNTYLYSYSDESQIEARSNDEESLFTNIFSFVNLGKNQSEVQENNEKSNNILNMFSFSNLANLFTFKSYKNCQEIKTAKPESESGIYTIFPQRFYKPIEVKCIMNGDIGYTVIQTRKNQFYNWHRSWKDYKYGFGQLSDDFWLGNEIVHHLTTNNNYRNLLVIKLSDGNAEGTQEVIYDGFSLSNRKSSYILRIGDQLNSLVGDSLSYHRNAKFSTFDKDNDENDGSCSSKYGYGWWFKSCFMCSLNGRPTSRHSSTNESIIGSINWSSWLGFDAALSSTEMMIQHTPADSDTESMRDCYDIMLKNSIYKSGVYRILINGKPMSIKCDMEKEGGGWTVIQARGIDHIDFERNLKNYVDGFGDLNRDFWFPLNSLHSMTKKRTYSVRFEFTTESNIEYYQEYKNFEVSSPEEMFRLHVSEPSNGNAGDSMSYHDGQPFTVTSTNQNIKCINKCSGGWWFGNGHRANLNGLLETKKRFSHKNIFASFLSSPSIYINSQKATSYKHASWDKVTGYRPIIVATRILIRPNERS